MGEISILLPLALVVASFVVVPFLGWGLSDPGAQWQLIRSWRGGNGPVLGTGAATRQRVINGAALALWIALLVWLFAAAG